jgi:phosphohistidine phosphatase
MDLIVVRSACAVAPRGDLPDEARALAPRGRKRARRAARALARLGVSRPRLLHSPRLRALETADVLLRRLGGEGVACAALGEPPSSGLLTQMAGERVVVVGHEPWLGQLVAGLVLGAPREVRFRLEKAGVAWLEGEARPGGMRLKALLPPKVLRDLARSRKEKENP